MRRWDGLTTEGFRGKDLGPNAELLARLTRHAYHRELERLRPKRKSSGGDFYRTQEATYAHRR